MIPINKIAEALESVVETEAENTRLRGILEQLRDGRGITIKDMEQALKWRGVNANVFRVY